MEKEKGALDELKIKNAVHQGPKRFSGTVYTIVFKPHPQGFANYTVATLTIENGQVKDIKEGDYYAGFECLARLDICNNVLLDDMRRRYPPEFFNV